MADMLQRITHNGWNLAGPGLPALAIEAVKAAQHIYAAGVLETPLMACPRLSQGAQVLLKLDNQQVTGSFKARGATHKVLSLEADEVAQGLVTCSTGNHALAFLHACAALQCHRGLDRKVTPTIYLPHTAGAAKADKLRAAGANLVFHGTDAVKAEREARRHANKTGAVYVSPYNDAKVAGGQGTIALELLAQLPFGQLDAIFVPVGGGGLISGIASVAKAVAPGVRIVGCQPAASDVMRRSVVAGRILDLPSEDTLSDGTAGGVEEGSITFRPCVDLIDEWVTVGEAEIARAMVDVRQHEGEQIEGSAGVAVAAFVKSKDLYEGKHVVIICCGGNVSESTMRRAEELAGQAC